MTQSNGVVGTKLYLRDSVMVCGYANLLTRLEVMVLWVHQVIDMTQSNDVGMQIY